MDNLTKRAQPDRSKINMHEAYEVKYWTHALGVSRETLQQAVDKVGNSAATVRKELGGDPARRSRASGTRDHQARSPTDAGPSRYLMLTNMPQAAASAPPVKTITGLSQNVLP